MQNVGRLMILARGIRAKGNGIFWSFDFVTASFKAANVKGGYPRSCQ